MQRSKDWLITINKQKEGIKMKTTGVKTITITLCIIFSFALLLGSCSTGTSPAESPDSSQSVSQSPSPVVSPSEDVPQQDTGTGEVKMTDGYYFYQGPRSGDMPCFIKFNEDGTYYAKYFMGAVVEAGLFVLIDKEMEYISDFGPDDEPDTVDDVIATASQVVVLTNYATGLSQEIAFDDNMLCDFTMGGMSGHNTMEHKPDYSYNPDVEEIALAVQTFYYQNDAGSSLTLYHNRTFNDFTTAGEYGGWAMENGIFVLTTDENKTYTLTVSDNGRMASYVKGSDTLELSSTTSDALYAFVAVTMPEGLPMDVDIALNCKADGTAEVVISHAMMGDIVVDNGTFIIENMVFITFELESGGIIMGEPDFDTASEAGITVHIPYQADVVIVTPDYEMPLSIDCILIGNITI